MPDTTTVPAGRAVITPTIEAMAASFDLHLDGQRRSQKTRKVYAYAVKKLTLRKKDYAEESAAELEEPTAEEPAEAA